MSYDVRLGVKVEGMNGYIATIDQPEFASPTYNLRKMFVACMDWEYKQGKWYNCLEVFPKILRGQTKLMSHPRFYAKFSGSNGYGSVDTAKEFLDSLAKKIDEIVAVDGWNEIPLERLWVRW